MRDLNATLVRAYARHPATLTLALSTVFLLLVWNAPFFRGAVIPYDYQTAHYPWYVDAIRAARYNPFCLYNPFNEAGQPTWNLFAFNDPVGWVPALMPLLPGYTALQSLELAHLILIPIGLLLVAWANDVPKRRWIYVAGISVAAFAMGPTLKYMQQSVGIVAYGYTVLLFGALEAFRRSGRLGFALLAAVCAAYIFEAFVYPAIFLPIALVAYAAANWRSLFETSRREAYLFCAVIVAVVVAAPALFLSVKIDRSIEVSSNLTQINEIFGRDVGSMLGAPSASLVLIAIPAAMVALALLGFRSLLVGQRWGYGLGLLVLILYGFGDTTAFGPLFRAVYPVAGLVRRPYATWYVVVPFVLVLATIGLRQSSVLLVRSATVVSAVAAIAAVAQGAASLAVGAVLGTLAFTWWRPTTGVLVLAAILQWFIIDWLPFSQSSWQPEPIPVAGLYLAPYAAVRQYLGGPQRSSGSAYRIANVGLPAQFGPSAGMFQYYNVAADFNTFFPRELVRELGTDQLHAAAFPAYLESHPQVIADAAFERLATRYYILGPDVYAALPRAVLTKAGLRAVDTSSYWKVVEDARAAPFVSGVESNGASAPIDAAMTRDTFRFKIPPGLVAVRFAQNYDSWWRAVDDTGVDRSGLLEDDGGQLALGAATLSGREISVFYTNHPTTVALSLSVLLQLALGGWFLMRLAKSRRSFGRAADART